MPVTGLPFSQRTTAAAAVFACIFIASPQGAQALPATVAQINALALSYGMLTNLYPFLIAQDVANQQSQLNTYITQAVTLISNLVTTLNGMSALTPTNPLLHFPPYNLSTPDIAVILNNYQIVAANMFSQITAAQNAPSDFE